jgi:hypothetical protein
MKGTNEEREAKDLLPKAGHFLSSPFKVVWKNDQSREVLWMF